MISSLSGCALVLQPQNNPTPYPTQQDLTKPLVEITFNLQIPEWVVTEGRLAIEILDEVTGLAYNPKRYDLNLINDQLFQVTLPFPSGSLIKYRYVRIFSGIVPEADSEGFPVRYRMFYATTPTSISDTIVTWEDQPVSVPMGALLGTVTDPITNQPIPDILVNVEGKTTFSDANGEFAIHNIITGVHNVVFYAIDGHYKTFQQGATIAENAITPANIVLLPMPVVNVTFNVTTPNDAIGAPIYLAGNLKQLGNTFTDLSGGMSMRQKAMPMLITQENGTHSLTLQLYAETDLRYKFTMGDGYWNAEQNTDVNHVIRQLIIPNHDVTIDLTVQSWRTPGFEPVTFQVSIPPDTTPNDEKYIQFKTANWSEPIPLWQLGSGNYLYILFSPFDPTLTLEYRFCRNEACDRTKTAEQSVQPGTTAQNLSLTLSEWKDWQLITSPTEVIAANIPTKGSEFITGVELISQKMLPSWVTYAPIGAGEIANIGSDIIIYSPSWETSFNNFDFYPVIGKTPFTEDLLDMISASRSFGLQSGLFPQVDMQPDPTGWWLSQTHDDSWWTNWFIVLKRFILHHAKIASQTGSEYLIIGGKNLLPAFTGGFYPDGSATDVPENSDEVWREIITEIRSIYSGKLLWAVNANQQVDPLPNFIYDFDEIFISVDAPLANNSATEIQELSASFNDFLQNNIMQVQADTGIPIILGFGYPAVTESALGCQLKGENCYSDGVYTNDELSAYTIDMNRQAMIYNAILPVTAEKEWISGIIIRGYDPIVDVHDRSSSVSGKPAEDVIWYWFDGLK